MQCRYSRFQEYHAERKLPRCEGGKGEKKTFKKLHQETGPRSPLLHVTNININYIVCQYKEDLADTQPRETKNEGSHFEKSLVKYQGTLKSIIQLR